LAWGSGRITRRIKTHFKYLLYSVKHNKGINSAGAYVTDLGSRKNFVLIFGHRYRRVLTIDRKWKIDVAIFSLEP